MRLLQSSSSKVEITANAKKFFLYLIYLNLKAGTGSSGQGCCNCPISRAQSQSCVLSYQQNYDTHGMCVNLCGKLCSIGKNRRRLASYRSYLLYLYRDLFIYLDSSSSLVTQFIRGVYCISCLLLVFLSGVYKHALHCHQIGRAHV